MTQKERQKRRQIDIAAQELYRRDILMKLKKKPMGVYVRSALKQIAMEGGK